MKKNGYKIIYTDEVYNALKHNKPVVALESTIISHGMPYPKNKEVALELESIVRENGSIPATIAIINGDICVGLNEDQIEYLANPQNEIIKTSIRDLPIVVAKGLSGATTVATTSYIASLSGIDVFATGGIGGVHRDVATSLDISNDLEELSKSDLIVVCAGVKSILDIPKTLEYLETKGVPVIGYKTLEMPSFYSNKSGVVLEYKAESPLEVAKMADAKWALGLNGAILVANPIDDLYSYPKEEIDKAIDEALKDASKDNISGKRATPYLLNRIKELTGGKSLEANINLVKSNARLASLIAKELKEL